MKPTAEQEERAKWRANERADRAESTIKSLCDRLERINRICHEDLLSAEKLQQVEEWSAGFMQIPEGPGEEDGPWADGWEQRSALCTCQFSYVERSCPRHGVHSALSATPREEAQ